MNRASFDRESLDRVSWISTTPKNLEKLPKCKFPKIVHFSGSSLKLLNSYFYFQTNVFENITIKIKL